MPIYKRHKMGGLSIIVFYKTESIGRALSSWPIRHQTGKMEYKATPTCPSMGIS